MQLKRTAALLLVSSCLAAPAWAGDKPILGPVPDWVVPAPELTAEQIAARKSVIPMLDEQTLVDGDNAVSYIDSAFLISNQDMLNKLGTISLEWQPAHGDLVIHKVEIIRGAERINLLDGGPGFTVLRREARLEQLTLDGELTAIMQAPGLRIGDVLRIAVSTSVRDNVLGGFAQTALMLIPMPTTLTYGRARLVWPEKQQVAWKALMPGVTAEPRSIAGGRKEITLTLPVAKLPELPKNIPARFRPIPLIEASSFKGWQDVATLMEPLYRTDGLIAEGSDLARTVDAIAATHKDPVDRMAAALRSVQDDVRYQLIAMGSGNYSPQSPAETWKVRFGDCKAKTLLLLAMLHRMGITAEPVLANSTLGDLVPSRLPAAQAFDHVFVRAEIAGESFWLDGTGLGTRLADIRDVPNFGHVLPLRASGAKLMPLPIRPDARPALDVAISYDGSAGLHMPVPVTLKMTYTGAHAEQRRASESGAMAESLKSFAEQNAKRLLDSTTIATPVASYDKDSASWTMTVDGLAYPEWEYQEGHWTIEYGPMVSIDFEADRSRSTWRDLPALVNAPWTSRASWSLRLPARAVTSAVEGMEPVKLSLPSVVYSREASRKGEVISSIEQSAETAAEVAPADIGATRKAVGDVAAHKLRVIAPADYPHRWDEVEQMRKSPALQRIRDVFDARIAADPKDAERYADRAWFSERIFDWAAAEQDYGKALELDPTVDRYLARAGVRSSRGDLAGTLKDAQAAYDLDTANKSARSWLAQALSDAGKTDEALDLIEAKPDLASEEGESQMMSRAQTLADGGRSVEAIELLDAGLQKRPSSAGLLNGRCWVKGLANTALDAALADCTRAIELAANPAAYYDSRAMVHFRAGRLDQARADLDAALAIAPELAASRFMRAVIAQREGDKAGAAKDFAAARKLNPSIDLFFARYGIKP